jgi:hypothetical protein
MIGASTRKPADPLNVPVPRDIVTIVSQDVLHRLRKEWMFAHGTGQDPRKTGEGAHTSFEPIRGVIDNDGL